VTENVSDQPNNAKAVITPLKRLLSQSSSDDLFAFIHSLHLSFALSCSKAGEFRMVIYNDGLSKYKGSNTSAKNAMIDALAQFLIHEQKDFHELKRER
jgi:hypothetical protein